MSNFNETKPTLPAEALPSLSLPLGRGSRRIGEGGRKVAGTNYTFQCHSVLSELNDTVKHFRDGYSDRLWPARVAVQHLH